MGEVDHSSDLASASLPVSEDRHPNKKRRAEHLAKLLREHADARGREAWAAVSELAEMVAGLLSDGPNGVKASLPDDASRSEAQRRDSHKDLSSDLRASLLLEALRRIERIAGPRKSKDIGDAFADLSLIRGLAHAAIQQVEGK